MKRNNAAIHVSGGKVYNARKMINSFAGEDIPKTEIEMVFNEDIVAVFYLTSRKSNLPETAVMPTAFFCVDSSLLNDDSSQSY
ncbi:MAG: hypothetical protein PUG54_10745 [Firmicutes bacterium]|nr:hypothetical protein [Bacillota bacterium]